MNGQPYDKHTRKNVMGKERCFMDSIKKVVDDQEPNPEPKPKKRKAKSSSTHTGGDNVSLKYGLPVKN